MFQCGPEGFPNVFAINLYIVKLSPKKEWSKSDYNFSIKIGLMTYTYHYRVLSDQFVPPFSHGHLSAHPNLPYVVFLKPT